MYANYAPASLYSNYSNYSELEMLRSCESNCDEEEHTEGLPHMAHISGEKMIRSGWIMMSFPGRGITIVLEFRKASVFSTSTPDLGSRGLGDNGSRNSAAREYCVQC